MEIDTIRSSKWQSTPVFLPGEFHGQKSLVGYRPWGCKELDMSEGLTHIALKQSSAILDQRVPIHLLTLIFSDKPIICSGISQIIAC